jgi:hypothetical protein
VPIIAHELVAATAKGMAECLYEELAKDNVFYKNNPDQKKFVNMMYPILIEQARTTLAGMLGGGFPEALKEQIHDALVKDSTLPRKRNAGVHMQNFKIMNGAK